RSGIMDAEDGPAGEQFIGECLKPAEQRGLLSIPAHGWHGSFDQIRRSLKILSGQRVPNRLGRQTILLVPRTRPLMQITDSIRLLLPQMRPENIGKKVVVAIPLALVIQRNDK